LRLSSLACPRVSFCLRRHPPRSTLFPYTNALPISRLWHGVFTPNCCTRVGRRRSARTKSEPTAVPTPSLIHHHAEAAIDHPLAVEGHGVAVLFQARVFHHLLHADVAHLAGGPFDPGEHHGFLRFQFHRHGEGGEFSVRYIVAPAFGDAQGAMLPEYLRGQAGMVDIGILVAGGYCYYKAVYIVHVGRPLLVEDHQSFGGSSRTGRTSMLPRRAGGMRLASCRASSRSRASGR